MNKSKLFLIIRILISLFLLALLFWLARDHLSRIRQLLFSVNLPVFGAAFLLLLLSVAFLAQRLKIILSAQKNGFFKVRDLFSLSLIGYFFTNFMPTSVGGDLVKGYFISKRLKSRVSSYTSVLLDRVMGMFSLVLIATVTLLIMRREIKHMFIFWTIAGLFLIAVIFFLLLFNKKLIKKIGYKLRLIHLLQILKLDLAVKKIYDSLNAYKDHKRKILQMIGISFCAQMISFIAMYFLITSLSAYIPFGKILLVMPVIVTLCMLPISMNGLGIREWGFVFFFSPDVGKTAALSIAFLYLAAYLLISILGGIIYLFHSAQLQHGK